LRIMELATSTVFSLGNDLPGIVGASADDGPGCEAGVLVHDGRRDSCLIRKFSAAGATLQIDEPVATGDPVLLELQNGLSIRGTTSWYRGDEAGVVFDKPVDVVGTLARTLATHSAERRRVPRVEVRQTVCIRRGNDVDFGRSRDISQAGVGVDTGLSLKAGEKVQVTFDGLRPLDGVVRWAVGGSAGIAFTTDIGWQTMMPWLRQVQQSPAAKAPARPANAGVAFDDLESRFGLSADKQMVRTDTPARVREGTRWWNVRLRGVTQHLAEFESTASFAPGTAIWLWLPQVGGWPTTVSEMQGNHCLVEFRLPLRQHELDQMPRR